MVKPPKPSQGPGAAKPDESDFICFYRRDISHSLSAGVDKGDADAQFELGRLYLEGRASSSSESKWDGNHMVSFTPGIEPNREAAVRLLQMAADQGHTEAKELLESMALKP